MGADWSVFAHARSCAGVPRHDLRLLLMMRDIRSAIIVEAVFARDRFTIR
jgi:hypothetical protein